MINRWFHNAFKVYQITQNLFLKDVNNIVASSHLFQIVVSLKGTENLYKIQFWVYKHLINFTLFNKTDQFLFRKEI